MKKSGGSAKRNLITVLLIAGLVFAVALVSVWVYQQMKRSLYDERVSNSNKLMEKISQNVRTGMQSKWDLIHLIAGELACREYITENDIADKIAAEQKNLSDDGSIIFLVDRDGLCYYSDGRDFRWESAPMLSTDEHSVYVSTLKALGKNSTQLFFLERFSEPVPVGNRVFTHVCLVCDMSSFDALFDMKHYGGESAAFVIHSNGTQVYKQEKDNSISKVYNVIAALEQSRFGYGGSVEKLKDDILMAKSGTMYAEYVGKAYFVSYCPLYINDWFAVVMIPEEFAGANTASFMQSIIHSVLIISFTVLAVLIIVILYSMGMIHRKQEEVNRQLQNAAEAERSANNAKTRFLSSMSHDIRTPMNAIIGMVTIAERRLDDPVQVKDCLDKVLVASGHLLTLINDILDISKVESGKMEINPAVFSLADTVSALTNIIRTQINAKNQKLEVYADNIVEEYLYGDVLRINQIFINILNNAVKYTPDGGSITVEFFETVLPEKNDTVRLIYKITDTGIGMSPEFQETMYDSFSRAVDSRIDKIQGSGLGLSICRQMIELMGGTIECDSEVNKGTVFTVKLDLGVARKEEYYNFDGSGTENIQSRISSMNILLADSDGRFLKSAAGVLNALGAHTDCAQDGDFVMYKAVEQGHADKGYDIIMIGWENFGGGADKMLERLRTKLGDTAPPLLVMTTDRTGIESDARAAGADGFVRKPFFVSTLCEDINEALGFEVKETGQDEPDEELAGIKILVAEDNDLNWEIIRELLDMYGIITERAENGRICVEKINAADDGEYDLILMDIQMPEMDGFEAAGMIRSSGRERVRTVPIIAMTANAFEEDVRACLDAGMDGHVAKPVDLKKLFREIEKAKCRK